MKAQRARPAGRIPNLNWKIGALAAFLVLDVILIALAIGSTRAEPPAPGPAPSYWEDNAPEPAPTTPPEVSPSTAPSTAPTAAPATPTAAPGRILAALSPTVAWRAVTGECPATGAAPELTTDGGRTWKTTNATRSAQVSSLQRILPTGPQVATMVGLSTADCSPQLIRTFVGGDNYSRYDGLATTWHLNPATPAAVNTPSGARPGPCPAPLQIAATTNTAAALLCADGRVHTTTDSGATWAALSLPEPISAIASDTDGYSTASITQGTCTGVTLRHTARPAAGCLPLDTSADALAGTIAVSAAGGTTWMWAGDVLKKSTDGGVTWSG